MAFVYKAERRIVLADTEDAKNLNVGPGSYNAGQTKQVIQSKAPFKTQTGRTGKAGIKEEMGNGAEMSDPAVHFAMARGSGAPNKTSNNFPQAGFTPGPGSYNISNGFDQIQRDMQSAKTLQGFGLDQFGIQFVKPSTNFASRVQRFQGSELGPKSEAPGPGQYNQESQWIKQKQTNSHWNKGATNALLPNPPSIPSHNNVFGYEENKRGELIRQKNTEDVHHGTNEDRVGPGQYQIDTKMATKGPTKWVQKNQPDKKIYEIKKQKNGLQPGPGHYQPAISSINPIYKNNKSSVFASNVGRASTAHGAPKRMTVVPNKQMPASGKYAAISRAAQSSTHRAGNAGKGLQDQADSDDDDIVPGPGAYIQKSDFKPETKPQRLQFFGSTVERFTDANRVSQNGTVGPGSYPQAGTSFAAKQIKLSQRKNKANVGFASNQPRFEGPKSVKGGLKVGNAFSVSKMQTPGPGHYQEAHAIARKHNNKTANGTFGCTERRFAGNKFEAKDSHPGPGDYVQPNLEQEIKRSSSMFISKTKRNNNFQSIVKKTKQNPGLERVCYDDKTNTISQVVKQRVEQINNPLLASLTIKNNTTMAFSSNAPRFNRKVMDEETYIGPGYYEQKSCFQKSRSTLGTRAKTGGTSSNNNLNNARSMQQIVAMQAQAKFGNQVGLSTRQPKISNTPGPGHYSSPDLNRWFKRSYNMNFSDV